MSKGMKIFALVAVCLIAAGIFVSAISGGFSQNGVRNVVKEWSSKQGLYEEAKEKVNTAETAVSSIKVDIVNSKIDVVESDVKTIRVTYFEEYADQYSIDETDDRIVISEKKNKIYFMDLRWILWLIDHKENTNVMKIEVPKDSTFTSCSFASVNGTTTVRNLSSDNLSATTINGSIKLDSLQCTDLSAKSTNGTLTLNNITATSLTANSVNGRIYCDTVSASDLNTVTVNGPINLNKTKFTNLKMKTVNGSMSIDELTGESSDYEIDFSSVNGNLFVNDSKHSKKYKSMHTADKSITASSVNGKLIVNTVGE